MDGCRRPLRLDGSGVHILEDAVSDRGTIEGLTQFRHSVPSRDRKVLILDGEMSEWLKEHAWKSKLASRTEPLESAPMHT
jgi:hypothetical protein